MSEVDILVQQAKQAFQVNDKAKAKELLLKAVDLDERNEQAWLWLSGVSASVEEQIICLENVLSINPGNVKAQQGLDKLKKSGVSSSRSAAPKAAPPPPPAPPAPKAAPANDPFAGLNFDEPFGSSDPWGAPAASPPPPPAAPAAYGSGRQVEQPSGDQYDDWISNMPIGGKKPASSDPFGSAAPGTDPFGSTAPASDPFGSAAPASDPWGSVSSSDPFGSTSSDPWGAPAATPPAASSAFTPEPDPWGGAAANPWDNDPFGSARGASKTADPFGASTPAFSAPASSSAFVDDSFAANDDPFASNPPPRKASSTPAAPTTSNFDFDAGSDFKFDDDFFGGESTAFDNNAFGDIEGDTTDPFAEIDKPKKGKKAAKPAKVAPQASPYFDQLPDEFKKGGSRTTLMAAAVLGVLNVVAIIGLVLAL